MNKVCINIVLMVFMISILTGLASASDSFVILDATDTQTMLNSIEYIENNGGKITHRFPPNVLIGDIPAGVASSLKGKKNIVEIRTDVIDSSTMKKFDKKMKTAADVWNNVYKSLGKVKSPRSKGKPKPLIDDSKFISDANKKVSIKPYSSIGKIPPYGAGYYDTSAYMIGDIAVGVVFLESNGAIDPNTEDWTPGEESNVLSEIVRGLNTWVSENPKARITFTYDIYYKVPTSYEPISRPYGDQYLWIQDAMTSMGFSQFDSYFDNVYDYNNRLRESMGTDWAYTVFVADSSNDIDGSFSNGYSAYAYIGGPFTVLTYDNGGYGISNMDYVVAHETGHIFRATDEYNGYTEYSGYLYAADIEYSGKIMHCALCWGVSTGTALQLGWRDNNNNLISDLIDFSPYSTWADMGTGNMPTIRGTSYSTTTYPNQNVGNDITINKIISIQYRIDHGSWQNAQPSDGLFDNSIEGFVFTPSYALSGGYHTVEVRSRNTAGIWESSYLTNTIHVDSSSITVVSPNGGENLKQGVSQTISWTSTGTVGNVKIELFKGGVVNYIISPNTPNTGSYSWTILSTQTPGTDYSIKITSVSDLAITDTSNSNFNIVATSDRLNSGGILGLGQYIVSQNGLIKLTMQVDGNLVLTSGTQVLWASGTNGKSTLNAIMQSDGNFVIYSSSGGAIWSSNTPGYPGAWLTVQNDGKAVIYDTSSMPRWVAPPAIVQPSITVTSPNGGESWKHGTVHTITWTKTGNPGTNVKIELMKGATVNKVLTSSKSGTSYSWTISGTQTPGTDYKIRITSASSSTYTDTSNNNFIIVT